MSPGTKVGFVTVCRSRLHHLAATLPANIDAVARTPQATIYVLDDNCGQGTTDWILSNCRPAIDAGRLVLFTARDGVPFNRAHAKNRAARLAAMDGAAAVYNIDADHYVGPDLPEWACQVLAAGRDGVLLRSRWIKCAGGRFGMSWDDFVRAGGYDEEMRFGWGYEDTDLLNRCRKLGAAEVYERELEPTLIEHTDAERENFQRRSAGESHQLHRRIAHRKYGQNRWVANLGVPWRCVRAVRNGQDPVVAQGWLVPTPRTPR